MRLIELSCDDPKFHKLTFNREGLTLIVGDGPLDKTKEGSSNGVGKTLSLGLVHHCLGANADPILAATVPNWNFHLTIEINGHQHVIQRSGNGKKIALDGHTIPLGDLKGWLAGTGVFNINPAVPLLSFRSLFKRFSRYTREDCLDPIKTKKEPDFDAKLRSLYLLGLDWSMAVSKRQQKLDLDAIDHSVKNWQDDRVLHEMFRAGTNPKLRAEWLEREIPRLIEDRDKFQVAEDFRAIELQAGDLTKKLREIEKAEAVLQFQLDSIDKSLERHPDISKGDLLDLYGGLQTIFKPEALAHLDAVEEFHHSLAVNRKGRLERDRAEMATKGRDLATEREKIASLRDRQLQSLQGKRALDEYATLARHIAELESERDRLSEFLNLASSLQERAQKIRERRVEEDRDAASYVASNPAGEFDRTFRTLAEIMYPRLPAGMLLESNTGDNQIRYNIAVQIEGDNSDGINSARIICFDWVLLMQGSNHSMGFLWHDNRLFAHIDPGARASWFRFVTTTLAGTGKQYIASLNTENFDAMKPYLTDEVNKVLSDSVRLTLRGDKAQNKLLGIQFGKPS
jgi:uncharacterized protein YydD (DUF2326 family)